MGSESRRVGVLVSVTVCVFLLLVWTGIADTPDGAWRPSALLFDKSVAVAFLGALVVHAVLRMMHARGLAGRPSPWLTVAVPVFVVLFNVIQTLSSTLHPRSFDEYLYAVDAALGMPGFASFGAAAAMDLVGDALPLGILALAQVERTREKRPLVPVMAMFVIASLGALLVAQVFPIAGPRYLTPGLEHARNAAATLRPLPLSFPSPRDGVLPLPFVWALVLAAGTGGYPRALRIAGVGCLVLAVAAGVLSGEHYLSSFPLAAAFVAVVRAVLRRGAQQTSGGGLPKQIAEGKHRAAFGKIAFFLFLSGMAGLVYEVVFAKSLALTFGSTATASTTVLATYMTGIALGSWLGGHVGSTRKRPLALYAACELGVAVYCAISPLVFAAIRNLYVGLAFGSDPASPKLVALQMALGALALLPPTILMGFTLPVLSKYFADRFQHLGEAVGLLYGSNTLGAAAGALIAGYGLLPWFGVLHTTWVAVVANLMAALFALRLDASRAAMVKSSGDAPPGPAPALATGVGLVGLAVLSIGGIVTLALETTYIHLLAVVAGNSAYAFSLMLFSFLLGLGVGSTIITRFLRRNISLVLGLAWTEIALAAVVLLSIHLWEWTPGYFGSFADFPYARTFASRELIRALVCCLAMVPAAVCIGAAYPLAMSCVTLVTKRDPVRAIGRAAAFNTIGNIIGALLGAFVLLPKLQSLRSLQILSATSLALGILPAWAVARNQRTPILLPALAVLGLWLLQPRSFDYTRLATGANVYFREQAYGPVIDHAESLDGGLTTVARNEVDGLVVHTLLTNGKFQGDDNELREVEAQQAFALFPLLHTTGRGNGLVIGLGTGTTAKTVVDAGVEQIDIVELSPEIVRMADTYFGAVNRGVLRDPHVRTYVTDGRNFLLLSTQHYDVITMEISSIWFAGAAALYNREFYELARSHLTRSGVLQQWVQPHHLSPEDIVSVLASIRSAFRSVWVYWGSQGIIVACNVDCRPTRQSLAKLDDTPPLARALKPFGGSSTDLLRFRILDPAGVDRFLHATGNTVDRLASDDDNLFLEYSTPRGNVLDTMVSMAVNRTILGNFRPPTLYEGTLLSASDFTELRAGEGLRHSR